MQRQAPLYLLSTKCLHTRLLLPCLHYAEQLACQGQASWTTRQVGLVAHDRDLKQLLFGVLHALGKLTPLATDCFLSDEHYSCVLNATLALRLLLATSSLLSAEDYSS